MEQNGYAINGFDMKNTNLNRDWLSGNFSGKLNEPQYNELDYFIIEYANKIKSVLSPPIAELVWGPRGPNPYLNLNKIMK